MSLEARYRPLTLSNPVNDGFETTYTTPVAGSGFIQPTSGNQSFTHLALSQQVSARLYCAVTQAVKEGGIVVQDGIPWIVLFADMPTGAGGVSHHKECLLGKYGS